MTEATEAVPRSRKNLDDAVREIPDDRFRPGEKARLSRLARDINEVARIDERSGEVFVDERRFRTLLMAHTPGRNREFADRIIKGAKERTQDGSTLLREGRDRDRALPWHEFVARVGGTSVPREETLEGWGLSPTSTDNDLRRAVKERTPTYPDALLQPGGMHQTADRAVRRLVSLAAPETEPGDQPGTDALARFDWFKFFQCFAASIPFWLFGAIIFGAVAALLTLGTNIPAIIVAAIVGGVIFAIIAFFGCVDAASH